MTPQAAPYREFQILKDIDNGDVFIKDINPNPDASTKEYYGHTWGWLRVIEHKAYAEALQRIATLEAELDSLKELYAHEHEAHVVIKNENIELRKRCSL